MNAIGTKPAFDFYAVCDRLNQLEEQGRLNGMQNAYVLSYAASKLENELRDHTRRWLDGRCLELSRDCSCGDGDCQTCFPRTA